MYGRSLKCEMLRLATRQDVNQIHFSEILLRSTALNRPCKFRMVLLLCLFMLGYVQFQYNAELVA